MKPFMIRRPRFGLIYVSKAVNDFSEEQLFELAEHAKRNNAKKGITGYLNYRKGVFFQFLQGEKQEVLDLEKKVRTDDRHQMVNTLYFQELDETVFPNWSMVYLDEKYLKGAMQEEVLESILTNMINRDFDEDWARKATLNMLYAIKYRNQRYPFD